MILPLFVHFLALLNLSVAANALLFEETFVRGKGKPKTEQRNFTALAGESSLIIHNGDANGKNRASSAVIILNGTQVVGPNEFNQSVGLIEKSVVLNQNNTLEVELRSAPGSSINVQIGQFPLTFTVSSAKSEYALSDPISLTLTLSLNPHFGTEMSVTSYEVGTISVISATRDGKPISPTEGAADFEMDPILFQVESLKIIAPGDRVAIPFVVRHVPGHGSLLIVEELNPDKDDHLSRVFSLAEPGLYTFQFLYHYTGPDGGKRNVFRDEVSSNTISFRLRQAK